MTKDYSFPVLIDTFNEKRLNYIIFSHNGKDRRCGNGVDGLLFYWIFWMGWIVTTFLYPKNHKDRKMFAAWLLISIMLSTLTIPIGILQVSGTGVFMIGTAYFFISRLPINQLLYILLSSFILMLVTVCFLLYELFDPVWLFMRRDWLLAIILTCVTLLLLKNRKQRIMAIIVGSIHGELFFSSILTKYSFSYPTATLSSLDSIALTLSMLICWNWFEGVASSFDKYFHSIEKEKQKLS